MVKILPVLVVLYLIEEAISQSCSSFTYTQHPPIPLTCKPYSNGLSPTWQLKTQCAVVRATTATSVFENHWMHRDSNGVVRDLGRPSFSSYSSSIPKAVSGGPRQVNSPFTESMVGQYWCQAFFSNGSPIPVYSDAFTVLRPEEYDSQIPVCSGLVQDVGTNICNNEPPSPSPPPSTAATITAKTSDITHSTISPTSQSSLTDHSVTSMLPTSSSLVHTNAQQPSASHSPPSTSSQLPPLSTSATISTTTISFSTSKSSHVFIPTVLAKDNGEPTDGNNIAIVHVMYCLAIVAVIVVSALVILAISMKKRIRKMFEKLPEYIDMLEIRYNINTHPTATVVQIENLEENFIRQPTETYITVDINDHNSTHYEALQTTTMDPTPEYGVMNTDTRYEGLQSNTMDPVAQYIVVNTKKD